METKPPMASSPSDPYSRLQYRRVIAWPKRIAREGPLIEELLSSGPARRVLDLGCGTGEHARHLAERGFEVVGVDRSAALLETAREEGGSNVRYVEADLGELDALDDPALDEGPFGGALCLGNTLPHLLERDALGRFFAGLRRRLAPGAPFLIQILNYDRILGQNVRHLPLNFRPDEETGGELVFLRLMEPMAEGRVIFCPTTLRFRPGEESPLEVISSRRVSLKGWRRSELEAELEANGFAEREVFGGFGREPFDPETSSDLLLIAR